MCCQVTPLQSKFSPMLAWKSPMHRHKWYCNFKSLFVRNKICVIVFIRDGIFLEIVDGFSWTQFQVSRFFQVLMWWKTFPLRRPHIEPLRRKDPGHSCTAARCKNLSHESQQIAIRIPSLKWSWSLTCWAKIRRSPESRQLNRLLLPLYMQIIFSWLVTNQSGHGLPTNPESSCD